MIRFVTSSLSAVIGMILILPVLALMVPIWGVIILCNLLHKLMLRGGSPWNKIIQFEPVIGWKPIPNLKTKYYDHIGDPFPIITGEDGWPGYNTFDESHIIVFGDSFAFGTGSKRGTAYYSLAKKHRIKPIGASGYTMVQGVMLMKRYQRQLREKLVVWFICLENDLSENHKAYNPLYYTLPFIRSVKGADEWDVVIEHVKKRRWLYGDPGVTNRVLFAYLCSDSEYARRVFFGVRYLMRQAKEICDSAGADLLVLSVPNKLQLSDSGLAQIKKHLREKNKFDPRLPERSLAQFCSELNVPFIAGSDHFTINDYKLRDTHWNMLGNKKVAAVIENYYETHYKTTPQQYKVVEMPLPQE